MNKYFDAFEFQKVIDLMDIDPYLSLSMFEQYSNKFPEDYPAYLFYCSNLIIIGKLDEAEKVYNFFEKKYDNDYSLRRTEKAKDIEGCMVFTKIKLLSYQKKYEELYQFCGINKNILTKREMNDVYFYSKKMTNRLDLNRRDENSYLFSQIVKYEEKDFLEHIKKHMQDEEGITQNDCSTIFGKDFPIDKVINEIKKYIPSNKKLHLGFYDNIYYFKYDSCGRVDNKIVDYFKVVCFDGTDNFITMCPVIINENLPYQDLNYLINEESFSKVKRISQIDKFNQKFSKNKKVK